MLAIKIILILIAIIILSLFIDYFLRKQMLSEVSVNVESVKANGVWTVFLPGVLASAKSNSADGLSDVWKDYGGVMMVEYGKKKFDPKRIVYETYSSIINAYILGQPFKTVNIVGCSMGGKLSCEVLSRILHNHPKFYTKVAKFNLILIDAPIDGDDLINPMSVTLTKIPFGPIWDKLGLLRFMLGMPKRENMEEGVDLKHMKKRVDEARSYRMSFFRDEVDYIVNHPLSSEIDKLRSALNKVVYIKSLRDNDNVRSEAIIKWRRLFPDMTVEEIDSPHAGFGEMPIAWAAQFREIYRDVVGLKPTQ